MDKELKQAAAELQQAMQNFNYADKNFIDVAVHQFNEAEAKINTLVKERKCVRC